MILILFNGIYFGCQYGRKVGYRQSKKKNLICICNMEILILACLTGQFIGSILHIKTTIYILAVVIYYSTEEKRC